MQRWLSFGLVFVLTLAVGGAAMACQYAVRDVGFVSLNDAPYELTLVLPGDATDDEIASAESTARAALLHSNITVRCGRAGAGGAFDDAAAIAQEQLPAAVLYDPQGRSAVLAQSFDLEAIPAMLGPLTNSPARDGLADALIESFGTVLLVEGTDATANARARAVAEDAIRRITANLARFDRVLEIGPSLRIIPADQRPTERWLLWSLDIAPSPQRDPEVAILYGQGRRLGPILQGDSLNPASLYSHLAIVAQDCECDLDRDWLYGKKFPLVWNDGHRQRAYDALGFDPESALVRAEVSRIIARGGTGRDAGVNDAFINDGGIGGLGLQIYDLNDQPAQTQADATQTPIAAGPAPTPPTAAATTPVNPAANDPASTTTNELPIVLLALAALGLLVGAGAIVMLVRAKKGAV